MGLGYQSNYEQRYLPQIIDPGALVCSKHRELILRFEGALRGIEGAMFDDCYPLKHIFAPGIYAREITLPKGDILVGKIHRHRHLNFMMSGHVQVFTEQGGLEDMTGPITMVSEPGTKRVVHVLEETVWTTIHHNPDNETDLLKLEYIVIAPSYEELMLTHDQQEKLK
jgi:hypothetical protein